MKIISWNVNGLRAVGRRNFLGWLSSFAKASEDKTIVCLQEIKCELDKIPAELRKPPGFFSYFNPAKKPGYSGTAVYSKIKPRKIKYRMGLKEFDGQGKFMELEFDDFILINLYLPHGGRGKEKLDFKLRAYKRLFEYLKKLGLPHPNPPLRKRREKEGSKRILLVGDFNIAHEDIDLARPKQNKNNIMFTPTERRQIDEILKLGFIDTFRKSYPNEQKFTWWPYFANARQRNLGWRIDYAFVSKKLAPKLKSASILSEVPGSDHCPIEIKI